MIVVKKRRSGIAYKYVWFAHKPVPLSGFGLAIYAQCKHDRPVPGFVRRPFCTKIVDLRACEADLLKNMSRRGAEDVKRAKREGVTLRIIDDAEEFLPFFNAFAAGKGLSPVTSDELAGWGREIVGLAAMVDGSPAAMHTYIVDRDDSRARLLHSASLFRQSASKEERAAIGRANRLLHYEAMLHFKAQGIVSYDLGGYAKDSADPQLANIAKFKDTLGGEVVREDHYVSLPLHMLQQLDDLLAHAKSWRLSDLAGWWRHRLGLAAVTSPEEALRPSRALTERRQGQHAPTAGPLA